MAKILVVEDSKAMRGLIAATLVSVAKHQVIEAENGFAALKELPKHQFDLLITDLNMPDMNGLELLRFVRQSELHKDLPVLLVSTDASEDNKERVMAAGANAYLSKPFQPDELRRTVQALLEN